MKELSIEEKAKRDDRLEKARKWYDANTNEGYKGIFEDIFPELKESEGERMWKLIKKYAHSNISDMALNADHITREQLESWLEKQSGQKSLDDIAKEVIKDKDTAVSFLKSTGIINENGELADEYRIEQDEQKSQEEVVDNLHNYLYGEQKPSLSEEDEKNLEKAIWYVEKGGKLIFAETDKLVSWLKSIKDRVQPKQEWSEEDERERKRVIGLLEGWLSTFKETCYAEDCKCGVEWLKSLKDRYTWKPSDEQMKALSGINVTGCISYVGQGQELINLYNDLKKLKGE